MENARTLTQDPFVPTTDLREAGVIEGRDKSPRYREPSTRRDGSTTGSTLEHGRGVRMRAAGLWAAAALMTVGYWVPVSAQTGSDEWDVFVAPYLMGTSMSGTATVRGREVEVDVSASDIFSNLQFGAMGFLVARKGNWGFGSDLIWMALGTTVRNINVDANQGAFAFFGLRRLGAAADFTFGFRINTLQGELTFKSPDVNVKQDKTWVDPFVGFILRTPDERAVRFRVYTEIGGFGLGSDLGWQVFPVVGIGLGKRASLELGWRWLDLDYKKGEGDERFGWDVLTQGLVGGIAFRF